MSGAESFWPGTETLLQDFQSGFSAMLNRCPPVELPFMCSWIAAGSRRPSDALLFSAVYLSGAVLFSWLLHDTGSGFYSPLTLFAARHLGFFHAAAGVFTLLAAHRFSGVSSRTDSGAHPGIPQSVFLCLFLSAYFALFESATCAHCPLFFAKLFRPAAPEHALSLALRLALYKIGHGAPPVLAAVFFTFLLYREKFKVFQEPARFLFSLPLALFGFYFLFIA